MWATLAPPALILAAVMALVVWRPRRLPVAVPASVGALVCIGFGLVPLHAVVRVLALTWNAMLTLVGLMILSGTLEANGAFRAAAHRIAHAAGGGGLRLFVGLSLLTAGATTILANDGAVLILTPIVAELALALALSERQAIAYLFAVGFLCDGTSTLLPTSNLTNILIVDGLGINVGAFFVHMLLPTLALVVVGTAVLAVGFQRDLPARYEVGRLGAAPPFSARSWRATWVALALLVSGAGVAALVRLPLGTVVLAVAVGLLVWEQRGGAVAARTVLRGQQGSFRGYAEELIRGVLALAEVGATGALARLFASAGHDAARALALVGASVALLAATINNLPVLLATILALRRLDPVTALAPHALPYAALIGANVGSKLTPIGSLATLLWLEILARRGLAVGWGRYLRLAALPTLAALIAALLALGFSERMF
jgi:arsenical pump membrane protein